MAPQRKQFTDTFRTIELPVFLMVYGDRGEAIAQVSLESL
jgi:hypothetical protein